MTVLWAVVAFVVLVVLYIRANDKKITRLPDNWPSLTTERVTPDDVRATAASLARREPITIDDQLPPKTGRRYIVVGGVRGASYRHTLNHIKQPFREVFLAVGSSPSCSIEVKIPAISACSTFDRLQARH
jgi:hypothetical protein